jgi:hypothetical protein
MSEYILSRDWLRVLGGAAAHHQAGPGVPGPYALRNTSAEF